MLPSTLNENSRHGLYRSTGKRAVHYAHPILAQAILGLSPSRRSMSPNDAQPTSTAAITARIVTNDGTSDDERDECMSDIMSTSLVSKEASTTCWCLMVPDVQPSNNACETSPNGVAIRMRTMPLVEHEDNDTTSDHVAKNTSLTQCIESVSSPTLVKDVIGIQHHEQLFDQTKCHDGRQPATTTTTNAVPPFLLQEQSLARRKVEIYCHALDGIVEQEQRRQVLIQGIISECALADRILDMEHDLFTSSLSLSFVCDENQIEAIQHRLRCAAQHHDVVSILQELQSTSVYTSGSSYLTVQQIALELLRQICCCQDPYHAAANKSRLVNAGGIKTLTNLLSSSPSTSLLGKQSAMPEQQHHHQQQQRQLQIQIRRDAAALLVNLPYYNSLLSSPDPSAMEALANNPFVLESQRTFMGHDVVDITILRLLLESETFLALQTAVEQDTLGVQCHPYQQQQIATHRGGGEELSFYAKQLAQQQIPRICSKLRQASSTTTNAVISNTTTSFLSSMVTQQRSLGVLRMSLASLLQDDQIGPENLTSFLFT